MKKLLNKHDIKIVGEKTIYQDTIYNIYLSISFASLVDFLRFLYISIISLIRIIFINKKLSSSKLYICTKK